jgi:enoyl-CoA hydratase
MMSDQAEYQDILVWTEGRVGVVQLNRPKVLNALNRNIMGEIMSALETFDAADEVGCIVVTGQQRAFAAGADISEMAEATPVTMLKNSFVDYWDRLQRIAKPVVAAVSGYALGGGCELAMACDMIIASETARFGQPEINIGVIPGAGGTQRLARTIGKALTMEMVLNGRFLTAEEALQHGLVNRVVPVESYLEEALKFAAEIADRAPIAARLAKEAINAAYETTLQAGLAHERRLFYLLFASEDQKEGMDAFINKRPAEWQDK